MHSMNFQDFRPYHVEEISIKSRETLELLDHINKTYLDQSFNMPESLNLKKAFVIQNKSFERDFNEKRAEIQNKSYYSDQWDIRFGFLSSNKEKIIDQLAEEGLEIKMYPNNYLGHNLSGLHISMNADICLNYALTKSFGNEIILLIFKYMFGRKKLVPMYDPKVLIAPTPNFNSHACEDRPIPNDKVNVQYIKSLVYLYEFFNESLVPVVRPRHCCPIGALIFTRNISSHKVIDLTETDFADSSLSYRKNPLAQLSTNSFWNYPFSTTIDDKVDSDSNQQFNSNEFKSKSYTDEYPKPSWDSVHHPSEVEGNREKLKEGNITIYGGSKYHKIIHGKVGNPY